MQSKNKSSLFLMEMMIAILFFSVTSALCIQVFVKARLLQQETERLNYGIALVEAAAELFRDVGADPDALTAIYPQAVIEEDTLTMGYDDNWQPCAPGTTLALLTVTFSYSPDTRVENADLSLSYGDEIVYELTAARYQPRIFGTQP